MLGHRVAERRNGFGDSTLPAQHTTKQPDGSWVIGRQCQREICAALGTGKVIALEILSAVLQEFPYVGRHA